MELIIFILLIPIFVTLLIACFLCGEAASNRGRGYGGWFFIAFFGSPLLAAVLLIALGDTEEQRTKRIMEDEELRQSVNHKHTHQEPTAEKRSLNTSAKTINDMYKR